MSVVPTEIASAEAFGTLAISTTVTVSPTAIASGEMFGFLHYAAPAGRTLSVGARQNTLSVAATAATRDPYPI